jgi:protoporphyrinogen oxidase
MGPRYTGTYGTGEIIGKLLEKLKDPARALKTETSAAVTKIINTDSGVEVHYVKDGKEVVSHAKELVFSASLKLAPKMIENFAAQAPEAAQAIDSLQMSNYAVHVVRTKGHPLRETYDLWMENAHDQLLEPTDVISSRWQDPQINGYDGMRNFKKSPADDMGGMTIYQPLGPQNVGSGFTVQQSMAEAEQSLDYVRAQVGSYLKATYQIDIEPELIETNRWPLSIHIAHPGWMQQAQVFKKSVGHIFFANNNMGLPEFEKALLFGKQAARNILERLEAGLPK